MSSSRSAPRQWVNAGAAGQSRPDAPLAPSRPADEKLLSHRQRDRDVQGLGTRKNHGRQTMRQRDSPASTRQEWTQAGRWAGG